MPTGVYVSTGNPALRRAVLHQLREAPDLGPWFDGSPDGKAPPGALLISTTSDCPAERCAELAALGVAVVILAAIPRNDDRELYQRAGAAAYLPMSIRPGELLSQLRVVAASKA